LVRAVDKNEVKNLIIKTTRR